MHSKPRKHLFLTKSFLFAAILCLLLTTLSFTQIMPGTHSSEAANPNQFQKFTNTQTPLAAFKSSVTPSISSISPTVQRSGLIRIEGTNFGPGQGLLRIDGKLSPFLAYWTDTNILAHVPESAALGTVTVELVTTNGVMTGNVMVNARQSQGRIVWRAEALGDYILGRPAIAPPGTPGAGTIYAATNAGLLYAWTSEGALKWVAVGASGDDPVSVGLDGTIYTASEERNAQGVLGAAVNAFNPDGTRKWTFVDVDSQSVRAGPSVGPDGKIYVIFRSLVDAVGKNLGENFAALRPDGSPAWFVNRDFHRYGSMGKELTFGNQLPHVYFAFDVNPDPGPGFVNGGTFAYDFDGRLVWEKPGGCCGVMAIPLDDGVRHFGQRLDPLTGNSVYSFSFPPFGAMPSGAPDAGTDNVHYIKGNSRLYAVNPNGTEKWHYDPLMPDGSGIAINSPVVNATNTTILLGAGGSFGQQSGFISVSPTDGREAWRQFLPADPAFPPYGNVFFAGRAIFSADGNRGYLAADINGDQDFLFQQKFCYFYALNTSADVIPVNQAPQVFISAPTAGIQAPKNTIVPVVADVHDDGSITKVEFYYNFRGNTYHLSTDTTAPYTATFQTGEPDTYGLFAVVTDAGGLIAESAAVGVIVTNNLPVVSWVSPANGASFVSSDTISLTAWAVDSDGTISNVEFTSNVVGPIGVDSTADANANYRVDFVNPPLGSHQVYAWATDNNGYRQKAIISINVSAAPTPTPTPVPTPTPTPSPLPTPTPTPTPASLQFSGGTYQVSESSDQVLLNVSRTGDSSTTVSVNYITVDSISANGCGALEGFASPRCDLMPVAGTLLFKAGETTKTLTIPLIDDSYAEGTETFSVVLNNPVGAVLASPGIVTVTLEDNEISNGLNPVDDPRFFVRVHYLDFLNRLGDVSGSDFWTREMSGCGSDVQCLEVKLNNVSASFFLSIEFQQTGFLVYRVHKAAFGNLLGTPVPIRLSDFLRDTKVIGDRLIVGEAGWESILETNKQAYLASFINRAEFAAKYPVSLTPGQYVDGLFANGEVVPSSAERSNLIGEFGGATTSADILARVSVLRRVAENDEIARQEFNRAFVLMQYFGYLRRNPDETPDVNFDGYNFWLNKMNQFNGNFVAAEMVKAFRVSGEYRRRFGM